MHGLALKTVYVLAYFIVPGIHSPPSMNPKEIGGFVYFTNKHGKREIDTMKLHPANRQYLLDTE